jgi:hypothetical protein
MGDTMYDNDCDEPEMNVSLLHRLLSARRGARPRDRGTTQLVLVQNWFEELKRLVPTK